MTIFSKRKWQKLLASWNKHCALVLLLFVSLSTAATVPQIHSNHITEKQSNAENYHIGYGYPVSAYHGYSPGSGSIGHKQDSDSGSAGGLSDIFSSLTSSVSGNGDPGTMPTEEDGSTSSALSLLTGPVGAGLGGAALGAIQGLLGLTGVTAFGLAGTFLFFMILGPVIAAGITVPIVAIVYASIYIPAIGLMNADDDIGELALINPITIADNMMRRSGGRSLARSVLDAQLCVERVSCEVGRFGRQYGFGKVVKWAAEKSEKKTGSKVLKRIARAAKSTDVCSKYTCDPVRSIRRLFK